jgi:hypothetical protein
LEDSVRVRRYIGENGGEGAGRSTGVNCF